LEPAGALNRLTLIFEAALDNPDPAKKGEGCRPVVEFWDSLKSISDPQRLSDELHRFYFDGLPGFKPAIDFDHFGRPFGQVRANMFVTKGDFSAHPWQLREWRVDLGPDGVPTFIADTVKDNPQALLFRDPQAMDPNLSDLWQRFQAEFVDSHVFKLTMGDQAAGNMQLLDQELFFKLGTGFPNRYNDFESQSQDDMDDPSARPSRNITGPVTARLADLDLNKACGLKVDHILNRAGALTCGGCHEFSSARGKLVAPDVSWPKAAPGGFVHIKEDGTLSELLEDFFLPSRRAFMTDYLNRLSRVAVPVASVSLEAFRARLPAPNAALPSEQNRSAAVAAQVSIESLRDDDRRSLGAIGAFRQSD